MIEDLNYLEIVKRLIGSVEPIGKSEVDEKRFQNLKNLCNLTENLFCIISEIANNNKNRVEHSMQIMGKYADTFLLFYRKGGNND